MQHLVGGEERLAEGGVAHHWIKVMGDGKAFATILVRIHRGVHGRARNTWVESFFSLRPDSGRGLRPLCDGRSAVWPRALGVCCLHREG